MNESSSVGWKVFACLALTLLVAPLTAQNGSGNVVEEKRQLSNFNYINVEDGIDVYLTSDTRTTVNVAADDNLISRIITEVKGKVLHVSMNGSYRKAEKLEVHISLPQLDGIEASGGSDVYSTNRFNLGEIKIRLSGGSDLNLEIAADKVYCDLSGGAGAQLRGTAGYLAAETSGGSDLKAKSLETKKCKLLASGGSDAHVWVVEELEMEASGASDIYYQGRPNILYQRASGASDIHSM